MPSLTSWSSIWSTICLLPFCVVRFFLLPFAKGGLLDFYRGFAASNKEIASKPSGYADHTLTVRYQLGLDIVGVGAAGQVYKIDENIVLKACRIYEPPSHKASPRALWDYASETVFHFGVSRDEKRVNRLLEQFPHPNIVEPIDTRHPEGIYFRKYQPLPTVSSPSIRILWYRDIIRAVLHLHNLGIAHSDIRMDNVLFEQGYALLSDFSASCPFGKPNPSLPVLLNGLSPTVSDATDRFAIGSLVYEMETGIRPEISNNHGLIFPVIHTNHNGLDSLIENAWHGCYDSTAAMLKHVESLSQDSRPPLQYLISKEELRARIKLWRKTREQQHGCIIYSLPTEHDVRGLARQYGWELDGERHFPDSTFVRPTDIS